jgi:predicted outer membrane lipoprotein
MALRLHAIVPADGNQSDSGADGTKLIPFRDLGAIVSEQRQFALEESQPADVVTHRAVVDALFQRGPVLPAPVGVLFRAPDVLLRWMELHYVALSDALEFVEDRAVGRVHIERAEGKADEREAGGDLAAAAAEAFRVLRRRSVAAVPLRLEKVTGLMLSAAFLVEQELWKEFVEAVAEQQQAHPTLRFELTGPWAPYDFVRMQFGG